MQPKAPRTNLGVKDKQRNILQTEHEVLTRWKEYISELYTDNRLEQYWPIENWWAFVDLEKAFDRVPRKVVEWAMRKLGVKEWLVRAVIAMYKHARIRIRSYDGSVSKCWSTPRFSAESTTLHYSNGSSDTQYERGSTMGDAIC